MVAPPSLTLAGELRKKFFYSPPAAVVTVVLGVFLVFVLAKVFDWGVVQAVWRPDNAVCYRFEGACWGFVAEKWRLIIFGRYPYSEQWRPAVATLAIVLMLCVTAWPGLWNRRGAKVLMAGWVAAFAVFFSFMTGGMFGLVPVDTDSWGGLPLTVILTLLGMTVSAPIGIALALGRRSRLPLVHAASVAYIELVRGVPLITVLFVASFIFPLLLPSGFRMAPFWRVSIGIILFQAAYMAETVRGGLQTIPNGQFLAAESLGLKPWQVQMNVVLPQALVAVIPAFVNSLLSTFMDTSLVSVVSMYDLTGSLSLALGDASWRDFFREGYIFIASIYFVSSFMISRYSMWLERRLTGSQKRSTLRI